MHRRCDSRHTLTSLRNDAVHAYSLQRDKHPTCNGALGYDEVALDLLRTSRLRGLASAVQRKRVLILYGKIPQTDTERSLAAAVSVRHVVMDPICNLRIANGLRRAIWLQNIIILMM